MEDLKIDDMQFEILNYLLKNGETRFSELLKHLTARFEHYGKESLKVIFIRKTKPLKDKGYIQRKDLGHQNVHYFIPQEKQQTVKLMLEREALKRDFNNKISRLNSPEEIEFYKKKLDEIEKELKLYKQLSRLIDLTLIGCLPTKAVLEKLEQKGLKDFDSNMLINIYDIPDYRPEDIEVFLIPASELNITEKIADVSKIPLSILFKYLPIEKDYPINMIPWILLTHSPIENYYIVGTYKIFSECYFDTHYFHRSWNIDWKGYYELSDEDWKVIEPKIREIVIKNAGRKDLDDKIRAYIINYLVNTKGVDDTLERLKKSFKVCKVSDEEAEAIATMQIEEAKKAFENE